MNHSLSAEIIAVAKKITKTIIFIALSLIFYSFSLIVVAQEVKELKEGKSAINTSSAQTPVVIETQVKGSQEQPKVIYILPWQGIDTPVIIEGEHTKIGMPNFKPINPKQFKKQASQLYNLHLNSEVEN